MFIVRQVSPVGEQKSLCKSGPFGSLSICHNFERNAELETIEIHVSLVSSGSYNGSDESMMFVDKFDEVESLTSRKLSLSFDP